MKKIPLRKNCRVDYVRLNGHTFSLLVDYINDGIVSYKIGHCELNPLYEDFKWSAINGCSIDNYPLSFSLPFIKIEGVRYEY